jgi:hypothetical protein
MTGVRQRKIKMKNKPKAASGKHKPQAKKLNINKDTVQNLSDDDLGKAQGGKGVATAASCSDPCAATKLLCPHKTTVPAGCPSTVTSSGCGDLLR